MGYDYFSKSPLKMSFIELIRILAVAAVITYHSAASETIIVRFFKTEIIESIQFKKVHLIWQSGAIFEMESNRSSISQSKFASSPISVT